MRNLTLLLITIFLISSCATTRAPSNLDNICQIYKKKRSWKRQVKRIKRKWDVPPYTLMAIIHQESKFVANARPMKISSRGRKVRASSAYGYAQAIDSTWKRYQKATGRKRAKRTNFNDATDFMGWYINANHKRNNVAKSDTFRQYLAYHEGIGGYSTGSYLKKPWLIEVAKKVKRRSDMYRRQMVNCK